MPNPFFAQSVVILFERAPDTRALAEALKKLAIVSVLEDEPGAGWTSGHRGLVLAYRPERRGHVRVDVIDAPWPDDLGAWDGDTALSEAAMKGWFGPLAFPQNLARASALSDAAAKLVGRHRGFVRVQLNYELDADTTGAPPDRGLQHELAFVVRVGRSLMNLPDALLWFNPNGEALDGIADVDRLLARAADGRPPLYLWMSHRLVPVEDAGWAVMDTLGLEQLGLGGDLEAAVPPALRERSGELPLRDGALPGRRRADQGRRHEGRSRRSLARVQLPEEHPGARTPGAPLVPGRRPEAARGVRVR